MQYREMPKTNEQISSLGFGCMRLPQGDKQLCQQLIDTAIDAGVNYFDTAYLYSGNEALMGELLQNGRREKIKLATKLPPALCKNSNDFDKLFATQLKRLQTDYVDFYLIHALADFNVWERLSRLGIKEWIAKKKSSGEIKNIGFSYHGCFNDFKRLIDDFDWDFTQLQYNYLDEHNQAGVTGVDYASQNGVPVVIMEPLRGGALTMRLPDEAKELLKAAETKPANLGLRWVWNHPGVLTVLSGMNAPEQLSENLETAQNALPLSFTDSEKELVRGIVAAFNKYSVVQCTGCSYCMPCPAGVNIPGCFSARNEFEFAKHSKSKKWFFMNPARQQYMHGTGFIGKSSGNASKCIKCGKCEQKCPQGIKIRDCLEEVSSTMEPFWFTLPMKIIRTFNSRK